MNPPNVKTKDEIAAMRIAGAAVAEVLAEVAALVRPGARTSELESAARRCMERLGARSSFLGYGPWGKPPYVSVLCVSVEHEVVHAPPGDRELLDGQIVSIDCGVHVAGFHGDSAVTLPVGTVSDEKRRLMLACRRALWAGIRAVRPGATLRAVAAAIEGEADGHGVVERFGGHGIGRNLHEEPFVANCVRSLPVDMTLREGMTIAIEPMLTMGSPTVVELDDLWTVVTKDGQPAAHFEHTIAVTADGWELLSVRGDGGATH